MSNKIEKFLKSLSEDEMMVLKEKVSDKPLTIKQIVDENPTLSVRLWNALELYVRNHTYITEINKQRFLKMRNSGVGTWNELRRVLSEKYNIQID